MDLNEFLHSLHAAGAPALSAPLRALWHLGREEWDAAHRVVQEQDDADSAWVHAHLHRVEGDLANARYWYARAGRAPHEGALDEEWRSMVRALIAGNR
jgi:hypothetical protein